MALFSATAPAEVRDKDFNEGIYHRPPTGLSFFKTGVLARDPDPDPQLLRLHEGAPVGRRGLHGDGDVRRTRRRCARPPRSGSPASTSARSPASSATATPPRSPSRVDEEGLPLHEDATITIRPRLFLEGNFFLDLRPGSPSAPDLPDGGDDPGHPDRDRGPARPGADRAAGARPREPRPAARRLRLGARRRADGRAGHRPGPRRPGQVRRAEAINESFIYGGARRQGHLAGQPGAARRAGRRPARA